MGQLGLSLAFLNIKPCSFFKKPKAYLSNFDGIRAHISVEVEET